MLRAERDCSAPDSKGPRVMTIRMIRGAVHGGVGVAAIAALLVGTGSDAQPTKRTPETLKSACLQLTGQTIPSSSIGLESGATTVASGTFVPAQSGSGSVAAAPDYCKVLGTIAPV